MAVGELQLSVTVEPQMFLLTARLALLAAAAQVVYRE
jgi:hypothetical protein